MREWTAKNAERVNAQRRERYRTNPEHAEKVRARARKWNAENKERKAATGSSWYEKNKDRVHELAREWREKYPDRWREQQRRNSAIRRARIAGVDVGDVDVAALLSEATCCALCKGELGGQVHIDHIVPIALGGPHSQANLQVTHPYCNKRKAARAEWSHLFAEGYA
jgi:5-methylcytosine-specific restriction endonuclease McrA